MMHFSITEMKLHEQIVLSIKSFVKRQLSSKTKVDIQSRKRLDNNKYYFVTCDILLDDGTMYCDKQFHVCGKYGLMTAVNLEHGNEGSITIHVTKAEVDTRVTPKDVRVDFHGDVLVDRKPKVVTVMVQFGNVDIVSKPIKVEFISNRQALKFMTLDSLKNHTHEITDATAYIIDVKDVE